MRRLQQEKGMALLLVLAVVALLTSLLSEFAFSTLVDLRLTETFRDRTRAWYLAKGGIQAGRMIRQEDKNAYDHPSELWGIGVPSYPVGENGTISIEIIDLGGRLNVNKLVSGNNPDAVFKDRFLRLFEELQQDELQIDPEALTDALIDWLDINDQPERNGAEDDHYSRLPEPYPVKNGPLDTLDELRLVKGFTPEVYRAVADFLTVHGDGTLNVNTADAKVLSAWDEDMDLALAEKILEAREKAPFEDLNQVKDLLDITDFTALNRNSDIRVKSPVFRIIARAAVSDGTRVATAVVSANGQTIHYLKVD